MAGNTLRKDLMESFDQGNKITVKNCNAYKKNHFMHFLGDVWKNSCFENFRRFPEKRIW